MAPIRVRTKLDLIDSDKIRAHALGHRLNRADPIGRARRHDPFFARHQRHNAGATHRDDPVIDLPRQQPQRQADDARAMGQHPLNRVVCLARIGRAKNGSNPSKGHHVNP